MGRWWIAVAGVAGILGAVLLIPKPQTGAGTELGAPAALPTEGSARAGHEVEAFQDDRGEDINPNEPDGAPEAGATAKGDAPGHTTAIQPEIVNGVQYLNPAAAQLARKRNTPEAIVAGQLQAPLTQVRRLLQEKGDDPKSQALAAEADQLVADIRDIRRNSQDWDFQQVEARMNDLSQRIRREGYDSPEMDRMLDLISTRVGNYHTNPGSTPP